MDTKPSLTAPQRVTCLQQSGEVVVPGLTISLVEALSSWHKALFNMTTVRIAKDALNLSQAAPGRSEIASLSSHKRDVS